MPEAWCVYSHEYHVDMGEHVFPVEKYRLIHAALTAEGVLAPGDIVEPVPASEDDLLLVHDAEHLAHMRRLAQNGWGFLTPDTPISPEILEKSILSAGGSILFNDNHAAWRRPEDLQPRLTHAGQVFFF